MPQYWDFCRQQYCFPLAIQTHLWHTCRCMFVLSSRVYRYISVFRKKYFPHSIMTFFPLCQCLLYLLTSLAPFSRLYLPILVLCYPFNFFFPVIFPLSSFFYHISHFFLSPLSYFPLQSGIGRNRFPGEGEGGIFLYLLPGLSHLCRGLCSYCEPCVVWRHWT